MSLIVSKKAKDVLKAKGLKTSDLAIKALNAELVKMCESIADTVLANNLKTVKDVHIPKVFLNYDNTPLRHRST